GLFPLRAIPPRVGDSPVLPASDAAAEGGDLDDAAAGARDRLRCAVSSIAVGACCHRALPSRVWLVPGGVVLDIDHQQRRGDIQDCHRGYLGDPASSPVFHVLSLLHGCRGPCTPDVALAHVPDRLESCPDRAILGTWAYHGDEWHACRRCQWLRGDAPAHHGPRPGAP